MNHDLLGVWGHRRPKVYFGVHTQSTQYQFRTGPHRSMAWGHRDPNIYCGAHTQSTGCRFRTVLHG